MLSEFLGTYFLTLTAGLNLLGRSSASALSIGASLMVLVYSLGPATPRRPWHLRSKEGRRGSVPDTLWSS